MQYGYLDIPYDVIERYMNDVQSKIDVCRVLPRARISLGAAGPVYNGLVCSPYDMGGEATGVSAKFCTNCQKGAQGKKGDAT